MVFQGEILIGARKPTQNCVQMWTIIFQMLPGQKGYNLGQNRVSLIRGMQSDLDREKISELLLV